MEYFMGQKNLIMIIAAAAAAVIALIVTLSAVSGKSSEPEQQPQSSNSSYEETVVSDQNTAYSSDPNKSETSSTSSDTSPNSSETNSSQNETSTPPDTSEAQSSVTSDDESSSETSENEIKFNDGTLPDYTSTTPNGYTIERKDGITYVDGIMIANKTYTLPKDYGFGITSDTSEAFEQMRDAAAQDGLSLFIVSGFRSYDTQDAEYAQYVYNNGKDRADTFSARAGHSEHQSGYALDLNSMRQSFADTAEGIWLAEHCADYGFIIRYPQGKDAYTGYMFEPWHIRYIGKEKAVAITQSGLTLEEYYGITSNYADCKYE